MLAGIIAALVGAWMTGGLVVLGWLIKRLVNKVDKVADHVSALAPRSEVEEVRETLTVHMIEASADHAVLNAHLKAHA